MSQKVSVLSPNSDFKAFDEAEQRHARALVDCFNLLKKLDNLGLDRLIKLGVEKDILDDDALEQFYGRGEYSGVSEANGYTVPELLKLVADSQEKMIKAVSGIK